MTESSEIKQTNQVETKATCKLCNNLIAPYKTYIKTIWNYCYHCHIKSELSVMLKEKLPELNHIHDFYGKDALLLESHRLVQFYDHQCDEILKYADIKKALDDKEIQEIIPTIKKIFKEFQNKTKYHFKISMMTINQYFDTDDKKKLPLYEEIKKDMFTSNIPYDDYNLIIRECNSCDKPLIRTFANHYNYIDLYGAWPSNIFYALCAECTVKSLIERVNSEWDWIREWDKCRLATYMLHIESKYEVSKEIEEVLNKDKNPKIYNSLVEIFSKLKKSSKYYRDFTLNG